MHISQKAFCEGLLRVMPDHFIKKTVLEIGSLNVNGTYRYLFKKCKYTGIDVVEGPGVDKVCVAHMMPDDVKFDTVFSTSSLEHDMFWRRTLVKMVELTKPGGLMFFVAALRWNEHGTMNKKPKHSGTSQLEGHWPYYYHNLNPKEVEQWMPMGKFSIHRLTTFKRDIQFWGIRNC